MDWVFIDGLEIDAVIGIHAHEQLAAQPLRLSLRVGFNNRVPAASGGIADTPDYAAMAQRLRQHAQGQRWHLIETLAESSAELLHREFGLSDLRLRIDKPLAVPEARSVGVMIERHYATTPMPTDVAATSRWLLVLGSNCDASTQLVAARAALAALGELDEMSEPLASEDVGGSGLEYLNQLVEIVSASDALSLRLALKAIERARGRSPARMQQGLCDLDIDLLARLGDDGALHWLADKPRQIPAVRQLLTLRFGSEALR
jgi:dihydroneopterin aldolase